MVRKPPVRVTQDEILDWMKGEMEMIVTPREVAERFGIHPLTAWRKLWGLATQGKLMVDVYDAEGHRISHQLDHRYGYNEEAETAA